MLSSRAVATEGEISFVRDVAPVIQSNCVGCHKRDKAKGKYRLDTFTHALKAVVAGNAEDSELFYRITSDDEDDRMPVDADPLPAADIAVIRRWIEKGAAFDGDDPDALLTALLPVEPHPAAPEVYPRPLPIPAMAFNRDGSRLITGGYYEILIWRASDGQLLRRIGNNGQRTYDLALAPNGKWLAVASGAPGVVGELRIFDMSSGEVVATPVRIDDVALCLAFDPDGKRLAFGGSDGRLRIIETIHWKETLAKAVHSDWINILEWNADGRRLATGSRDKSAKVFDMTSGAERLATFSGHDAPVRGVSFHSNGENALSAADDGLVLLWKIADGKKVRQVAVLESPIRRLILDRDRSDHFGVASSGTLITLEANELKRRDIRLGAAGSPVPVPVEIATHQSKVAVGTLSGEILILDPVSGKRMRSWIAAPGSK